LPRRAGLACLGAQDWPQRVVMAPEGTRNDTLNRAAFGLGQLVAAGMLPRGR